MTEQILAEGEALPFALHHGDCIDVMRGMADSSVDAIVTDPPYELGFMGKSWDATGIANSVEMWREALRVLKPGGYLLAFGGTRTSHRMVCAIEDSGFEIRDSIPWIYGSGFPKSLNVSKAIDKAAGAEREVVGRRTDGRYAYEFNGTANRPTGAAAGSDDAERIGGFVSDKGIITAPATDAARQWEGWGTALKPAHEPCCMARKPLIGTVAANLLAHGTGALNIDGCRVGDESTRRTTLKEMSSRGAQGDSYANQEHRYADRSSLYPTGSDAGRWPANIIHDGSDEVVALFPDSTSGSMKAGTRRAAQDGPGSVCYGTYGGNATSAEITGSTGSAARFFYCAKASRADRNEGLACSSTSAVGTDATMRDCETADWSSRNGNHHPTVKPTDLMAYLVRLVTPPGGVVLDPFMGSGSTGKACMREGMRFVGIDLGAEYVAIARARIAHEHAAVAAAAALAAIPSPQRDLFQEAEC